MADSKILRLESGKCENRIRHPGLETLPTSRKQHS
jgi:hypothetical protein